jgi:hypothetical protein
MNKKRKKFDTSKALWESFADTCFATVINIPINYLLVAYILEVQLSPWTATIFMTGTFFSIAIARKTYVRYLFWRSENRS